MQAPRRATLSKELTESGEFAQDFAVLSLEGENLEKKLLHRCVSGALGRREEPTLAGFTWTVNA